MTEEETQALQITKRLSIFEIVSIFGLIVVAISFLFTMNSRIAVLEERIVNEIELRKINEANIKKNVAEINVRLTDMREWMANTNNKNEDRLLHILKIVSKLEANENARDKNG